MFISSFISHGERTPLFTYDSEFYTTKAEYDRGVNKLTLEGEKHMNLIGVNTRKHFVDDIFLPKVYDPQTIMVRGPTDNPSVLSGYAYIMGIYPNSVEGVDLMQSFGDLTELPINEREVNRVREDLYKRRPTCGTQRVDYYPGNDDHEFLIKPMQMYPGIRDKLTKQLLEAKEEFEGKFGERLYHDLAKKMHKGKDQINFSNALLYLDDYLSAIENFKAPGYTFSFETNSLISEYYKYYYGHGYFRDEALTRLFTDAYFTNIGKEIFMKHKALTEGKYVDTFISKMKHSIHIGNHQTYVAILHMLGERSDYKLDFAQRITWNLFKRDDEYYVKVDVNKRALSLGGVANKHGEMKLGTFFEYICSRLYRSDSKTFAQGTENSNERRDAVLHCINQLDYEDNSHKSILLKSLYEIENTLKT